MNHDRLVIGGEDGLIRAAGTAVEFGSAALAEYDGQDGMKCGKISGQTGSADVSINR
jgi:hypothetical protein